MTDQDPPRRRRQPHRTGWRCQLRVRVPDGLAHAGEVDLFRNAIVTSAAERGLSPISVQAVAADRSVSLLIESVSDVSELTEAVKVVERMVREVAAQVWPDRADDVVPDSVAARRL